MIIFLHFSTKKERERHQVEVDELNSQLEANKQYLSTLKRKEIENKKVTLIEGKESPEAFLFKTAMYFI